MNKLKNKIEKLLNQIQKEILHDLFFTVLAQGERQKLYRAVEELRSLRDNLPER